MEWGKYIYTAGTSILRSDSCALIICSSENQETRNVVSRNTSFQCYSLCMVTGNMQFDYRKVHLNQKGSAILVVPTHDEVMSTMYSTVSKTRYWALSRGVPKVSGS